MNKPLFSNEKVTEFYLYPGYINFSLNLNVLKHINFQQPRICDGAISLIET